MDVLLLWVGWLAVWVFGAAVLLASRSREPRAAGELAFVAGCGFFVGQFVLTVWMRLLATVHVPFGRLAIGMPLLALTALALATVRRRHGAAIVVHASRGATVFTSRELSVARRALGIGLLAWLALRFALLLGEVLRRPLYPADAWTQWASKARVFYEERTLAPFVSAAQWLATPNGNVWFDAAPDAPATVPLTQVWSAILLGRFDDALVNLPWWLTAVALGFALFGFLRRQGVDARVALVGTWLALSLPILDTHVALAGDADLPLSAYFTLSALALVAFLQSREHDDLALALVLAIACVIIERSGKLWLATLVPALVAALLPRYGLRAAGGMFALAGIVTLVLARVGIGSPGGRLHLDFDMPWSELMRAYFTFANWHLLFYGAFAVALLARGRLLSPGLAPLTLIVAAGFVFLLFGSAFPSARIGLTDGSSINRATLHLAPLIVVWMMLAIRACAREVPQAIPASAAPPVEAPPVEAG